MATRSAKKKTATKPGSRQTTEYVILRRDNPESGWFEYKPSEHGQPGVDAIKRATKKGESHDGGEYKAVPRSTWESEGNNLTILTEVKEVTSFLTPGKLAKTNGNGSAPPAS